MRLFIIIGTCLLLSSILGGVFFWWPKYQDFSNVGIELRKKEIELSQKEDYFASLKSLSDKLAQYPEELGKINSALPDDLSVPALFSFIQEASSENGLVLENLDLGKMIPDKDEPRIKKVEFAASVSGSYAAFKNFLSALYNNTRMVDVKSISFMSPTESNLFSLTLDLVAYSHLGFGASAKEEETEKR